MINGRETVVIPKEDAVFWLDGHGRWHNAHGPFENKKISAYFHSCIRRDADGYHVYQETEERVEKVYFRYEDTALFATDLRLTEPMEMRLNTGKTIAFDPERLSVKNDSLYYQTETDRIKLTERAMMALAARLETADGRYYIQAPNGRIEIPLE